jgi:hypothetical protein
MEPKQWVASSLADHGEIGVIGTANRYASIKLLWELAPALSCFAQANVRSSADPSFAKYDAGG